jgi:hypothetical protein
MDNDKDHQRELQRNLEAFQRELPRLLVEHEHEYALLHHGRLIGVFPTAGEAFRTGKSEYGPKHFSVQWVIPPVNLGYQSYALQQQRGP